VIKAGVALAYWPWLTYEEQLVLAVLADELGLDSLWVSESWGQEAVALLGALAARTERIGLGAAIFQIPARKATTAAMVAASLDVISAGRIRLGFGPSGPQVSEGWYGEPFARPLARTRAYVDVVRRALDGERIALPLPEGAPATGLAKPLRLLATPVQERIPIYLGAVAPKGLELCGEIADGWLGFMLDPDRPEVMLEPLLRAIEQAGRSREAFDVATIVPVCVDDDSDHARTQVRPWLAFYLGAMGAREKNFYVEVAERYGHGASAREVQERWLGGDREGAANAVPDELLDSLAFAGPADALADWLARYARAGVDTVIALPCGDRPATVRALAGALSAVPSAG
jgi:F420-dependent oxidoreductase-like protein